MDERHGLAGAGPWTAAVGSGGQGPGRRARYSSQFTSRSRHAPADRIPGAVVSRGHNMPAPHGLALTRPASTPERPRPREYLSRRDVAGGSESDAESERAPVRKGPSPVGLAVAFALAPLTSQQQGRSAASSPRRASSGWPSVERNCSCSPRPQPAGRPCRRRARLPGTARAL